MTTLCIDVGNTNIVCALHSDGAWLPVLRLPHTEALNASQLATQLGGMLVQRGLSPEDVVAVGVASVVPASNAFVSEALQRMGVPTAQFVAAESAPLKFVLPDPNIVGADRIANIVAARAHHGAPVLVIDFGTATTFEYVTAQGTYLSGPIVPGIELQREALVARAAQLDTWEWNDDVPIFVEDTPTALQSGLLYSTVGAVDRILDMMLEEAEVECPIVATGGLAELVAPHLAYDVVVDSMLTLEGVRLMTVERPPA